MLKSMSSFVSGLVDPSKSILSSFVLILVIDYILKDRFGLGNPSDVKEIHNDLINTKQICTEVDDAHQSCTSDQEIPDGVFAMILWVPNYLFGVVTWILNWSLKLQSVLIHLAAAYSALCVLPRDVPARCAIMTNAVCILPLFIVYNFAIPIPFPTDFTLFIGSLSIRFLLGSATFSVSNAGIDASTEYKKEIKLFLYFFLFFVQGVIPINKELFIFISAITLKTKLMQIFTASLTIFDGLLTDDDGRNLQGMEIVRRAFQRDFQSNRGKKAICAFWTARSIYNSIFLCGDHLLDLDVGTGFQCVLLNGANTMLDLIGIAWIFSMLVSMFGKAMYILINWSIEPDGNSDKCRDFLFTWAAHLFELSVRTGLTSFPSEERLWNLGLNMLWIGSICLDVILRSISKTLTSFIVPENKQLRAVFVSVILLGMSCTGLAYISPNSTEIRKTFLEILAYTLSFNLNFLGICGGCVVFAWLMQNEQAIPKSITFLVKAICVIILFVLILFFAHFLCSFLPDILPSLDSIILGSFIQYAYSNPFTLLLLLLLLILCITYYTRFKNPLVFKKAEVINLGIRLILIGGSHFLMRYVIWPFASKRSAILEWSFAAVMFAWNYFAVLSIFIVAFVVYKEIEVIRRLIRKYPFLFAGTIVFLVVSPGAWHLASLWEQISEFRFTILTHVGRFNLQLLATLLIFSFKYFHNVYPDSKIFQSISVETIDTVLQLFSGFVDAAVILILSARLIYNGWLTVITLPVLFNVALLSEQKIPIMSAGIKLVKMKRKFTAKWTAWNAINAFPDATMEQIQNLRDDVCAICRMGMDAAKLNHCGHALHAHCLHQLLANSANKRCPYCQAELRLAYTKDDWRYSYVVSKHQSPISGPGFEIGVAAVPLPDEMETPAIVVASISRDAFALRLQIQPGDIIERINGVTMLGKSLESATNTINSDKTYTRLYTKRRRLGTSGPKIIQVELRLNNRGFGFSIDCTKDGIIRVSEIHGAGAALDDGLLEIGDQLLAVGNSPTSMQSLENITVNEAKKRVEAVGDLVVLVVMKVEKQTWLNRILS